jgi:hypothetical protein
MDIYQGSILIHHRWIMLEWIIFNIDRRLNNSGRPIKKDRMFNWWMNVHFSNFKNILEITALLKTTLKFFCGTSKIKTGIMNGILVLIHYIGR